MVFVSMNKGGDMTAIDVSITVNEIGADGNYREIYMSVAAYPQDGFNDNRRGEYSITVDGETYSNGNTTINGDGMWMFDSTFDVYVEPGTTYAEVNIPFSAGLYSETLKTWRRVSGTITKINGLSLIADTSISSTKDIYFGDACSITWTPASNSFTYKLQFSMGNYKYTTNVLRPNTTSAYTYNGLIIPESEAVNIPDSEYGMVAVSLIQYSDSAGTTTVGASSTKSFRITLKDSVIPKINTCTATIDNSDNSVVKQWGVALSGYTKVKVSATASGVYGSTIKSFSITGDYKATINSSTLNYTGKAITKSGNRTFTVRCTDSRGRVSEQVITDPILFLPYTLPKVTKLTLNKEDYGDQNISNDRMVATATWTFDSVNGHNSATGKIEYKISTAEDWTAHTGTLQNGTPFTLSNLKLSDEVSYNFRVVVTDALGSTSSKDSFSSTTRVLMDFQAGGMGLGIGKICEIDNVANDTQSLEVSMDSYFFSEIYIKDKTQTLEDYIKNVTRYLVEGEDYGDDDPAHIQWATPPKPGQIYYMKVAEE